MKQHPKVLIVGTVPYNKNMTSRAFDAYFHNWERENLVQFFSNSNKPIKGHCGELYQVTDQRLVKRIFNKKLDVGQIYYYKDLNEEYSKITDEPKNIIFKKLDEIGHHKTSIIYLLRGIIWRKKYWCTKKFNNWIDKFKPDCVFLSFSDDFFIPNIALYVAERFDIPIVSSIGDDYYFNNRFSLSPFYYLYRFLYKRIINKVFSHKGSAIYISDKIRDKYNAEFKLNGDTIYLTSEIQRKKFKPINIENPIISYFGNINLGRNYLLSDIGEALGKINKNYFLNVYSNETSPKYHKVLDNNNHIKFWGKVPYDEVLKKIEESDIIVIVEGYSKKDIIATKYSLSTKAADSLASGTCILTYGSMECGIIEYMNSTNASVVCTDKKKLSRDINNLINNVKIQKDMYLNASYIYEKNHKLSSSNSKFEKIINRTIKEYDENAKR